MQLVEGVEMLTGDISTEIQYPDPSPAASLWYFGVDQLGPGSDIQQVHISSPPLLACHRLLTVLLVPGVYGQHLCSPQASVPSSVQSRFCLS